MRSRVIGFKLPNSLINGVLFNITWLAIVMTHSNVYAPLIVAAHLLVHFWLMGKGLVEAKLILAVSVLGLVLDQLLFRIGVFTIGGAAAFAPLWLTCLWPVVATSFMHAFAGFQQRYLLATVLGAIGGGASYTAGTRLTDVEFASTTAGPWIMAVLWAVLLPLLLQVARRIQNTKGELASHD